MMEDGDYPPLWLTYPVPAESPTGIHVGSPRDAALYIPDHLAEVLEIAPLERCALADEGGYDSVLESHARLMMERDLKGLKLCGE